MLLTKHGHDVTPIIDKMQKNNPKVYRKNRENLLSNLTEKKWPLTHYPKGFFCIEARARMV